VFEVVVDGALIYSKKATGQFPDDEQLVAQIAG
jgi:selT/selW/selH-like putative selenoprotein